MPNEPQNTAPADTTSQVNGPLNVDIFEAQLNTGIPYPEMARSLNDDDNLVPLKDPGFYYEKHADKFNSEDDFKRAYDVALGAYDELNTLKYQKGFNPLGSEHFGIGMETDPYFGMHHLQSYNDEFEVFGFNTTKNPLNIETNSQNATRNGMIYEPGFVIDQNGEAKYIEDGRVRKGELDFFDRLLGDYYVTEMKSPDGEPIVDNWGRKQYAYKRFPEVAGSHDGAHYNLEKASIWGDQALYGQSFFRDTFGKFLSTASVELVQGMAQMGNIVLDASMYTGMGSYWDVVKTDPKAGLDGPSMFLGVISQIFDQAIETGEGMKYRASQQAETAQFFGSGGFGFFHNVGVGLGYIAPQRWVASGIAKAAPNISKNVLRGVSTSLGTSQAINGFYRSAREAGLAEKEAAYMAMMAMPAVASTEYIFNSKWLTRGLGADGQRQVTNVLKNSMAQVKEMGIDPASSKGMAAGLKKTFNTLTKDKNFMDMLYSGRVVGPAILEGSQESSEEVWYAILEDVYDRGFLGFNPEGRNAYGTDTDKSLVSSVLDYEHMERYFDNFIAGAVIGGIMDATMLGAKDRHKDKVIDEMVVNRQTGKLLGFVKKSFESGKLGVPHKDVNNNVITQDEQGNPVGETFVVPEDVSFNGDLLFQKDQELSTMNEMAYYETVMDVLAKEEVVQASGLANPEVLNAVTGQHDLLSQALGIWTQMDNTKKEIANLQAELNKEDADTEAINDKIAKMQTIIDGEFDNDGNLIQPGLKQQFEYITQPAEVEAPDGTKTRSEKSQAFIDNVKHGAVNGLVFNKNRNKYESGEQEFSQIPKDATKLFDERIHKFMFDRHAEKQGEKYYEDEQKLFTELEQSLGSFLSGEVTSLGDIMKSSSALMEFIEGYGTDQRTLDSVSNTIVSSARKFSEQAAAYWAEKGLSYEPGEDLDVAIQMANMEKEKGAKDIVLDANERDLAGWMSETDAALANIAKNLKEPAQVREQNQLTPGQDKNVFYNQLYKSLEDALNSYDQRETISDIDATDNMKMAERNLDILDAMMHYAGKMNEIKGDPNYEGIISHEPTTEVEDNNVDPGWDIPQEYLEGEDGFLAKNRELRETYNRVKAKIKQDAGDIRKHEQRRAYAVSMQKSFMINRLWAENSEDFDDSIKVQLQELDQLHSELLDAGWTIDPVRVNQFNKKLHEIEDWIYRKAKNDPSFHERMIQNSVVDSDIGMQKDYHDISDNQSMFFRDRAGNLNSVNDVPFETIQSHDKDVYQTTAFMRMTNYINSMVAFSGKEFNNILSEVVSQEEGKLPGVEQVESIRLIVTAGVNQQNKGQFLVRESGTKAKPAKAIDIRERGNKAGIVATNAVSIDGSGGVGKTTVITSMAFSVLDKIYQNSDIISDVTSVAPSETLKERLNESLKDRESIRNTKTFEYNNFITKLKSPKQSLDLEAGSILVIDESSRITLDDMGEISAYAKNNDILLVLLGDSMQATEKYDGNIPKVAWNQHIGIRGSRINMKFRTGIDDISKIQDALAFTIKGANSQAGVLYPQVGYTENHDKGVRYANTQKEVQDQWKEDVTSKGADGRILIFEKKSQADQFKGTLPEELKKFRDNVKYIFRDTNDKTYSDPGTVQGLEFDYVYVSMEDHNTMPPGGPPDLVYRRRALLTAESRAQRFVMMPVPNNMVDKSKETSAANIHETKVEDIVSDTFDTTEETDNNEGTTEVEKKKPESRKKSDKKEEKASSRKTVENHEMIGTSVRSSAEGKSTVITEVGTNDNGDITYIALNNGRIYEGDTALYDLQEDYTEDTSYSQKPSVDKSVESVEDQEKAIEDNDDSILFMTSAKYHSSQGIFPVMINVAETVGDEARISEDAFFSRYGKAKRQQPISGSFELVYSKEKNLYTRRVMSNGEVVYEPQVHYNVISMYDGDTFIGVFPAPDTNFSDKKAKQKFFSSQKEVDYSWDNLLDNQSKVNFSERSEHVKGVLDDYHKDLIKLNTIGSEASKNVSDSNHVVIGEVTISESHSVGATVNITKNSYQNPKKLDEFISDMEDKGVVFRKVGKKYRVIQRKNSDGEPRWYLLGSYFASTKNKNAAPIHEAAIPVKPRELNEEDKREIRENIKQLRQLSKGDGYKFINALYNGVAFQTLRSNLKKITETNNLDTVLRGPYAQYLSYQSGGFVNRGGKLSMRRGNVKGVKYDAIVNDLENAVNILISDANKGAGGTSASKIYAWYPITMEGENIYIDNVNRLETAVDDIRGPYYRAGVNIDENIDTGTSSNNTATEETLDNEMDEDFPLLEESQEGLNPVNMGNVIQRNKDAAIAYVRQVLGDEYVKEFLSFSNDPKVQGKRYWGYTQGLNMVLRATNGNVAEQAFRHEPIHIITQNLMSQDARAKLYDSVRSYLGQLNMTDTQADEALARLHHNKEVLKTNYKNLPGILNRFLEWLGNLWSRFQTHSHVLNEFFSEVESGKYANKINSGSRSSDMSLHLLSDDTVISLRKQENNVRYNELGRQFGGNDRLNNATNYVFANIKRHSAANGFLTSSSNSLQEAVQKTKDAIQNDSNIEVLNSKFDGVGVHDLGTKFAGDPFFKNMKDIELKFYRYTLAKGNNLDTIIKHIFPGVDTNSEEFAEQIKSGYEESAVRNPDLYIPNVIRTYMHTIRYQEFNASGEVRSVQRSNRSYVDYDLLKKHLITAITYSRRISGKTDLDGIFTNLRKMANAYGTDDAFDNESRNTILSFLEEFGKTYRKGDKLRNAIKQNVAEQVSGKRPRFSHYMMAHHFDLIQNELEHLRNTNGISQDVYDEATSYLKKKSRESGEILNAVVTAMNLRTIDSVTISHDRYAGQNNFVRSIFHETSTAQTKRYMKGRVDLNFMSGERTFKESALSLVDGTASGRLVYNVDNKKIKLKGRKNSALIYRDGNWKFTGSDLQTQIDDASDILYFLGTSVRPEAIQGFFRNDDIQQRYGVNGDVLANYLGHMLSSVRYHQQFEGNDTKEAQNVRENIVTFLARNNMISGQDAFAMHDPDTGELNTSPVITDFYRLFDTLAEVQGFISGRRSPHITQTVSGNMKANQILPNRVMDVFSKTEGDVNASDRIVQEYMNILGDESPMRMNVSPMVTMRDGEASYNEPLIEGLIRIDSVNHHNGIKSYKGVEISDWTKTDYYNAIIALFHDSVFSGREHQVLSFTPENIGDSSQLPIFNVAFGNKNNPLLSVSTDGEKTKMDVNEKIINENLDKIFDYHYKSMLISLNKWYQFFEEEGYKQKIDQEKYLEDQEKDLRSTYQKTLQYIKDHPNNNKQGYKKLVRELEAAGMIKNRDFVIENGYVKLGKATRMDHDIFNLRNYSVWKSDSENVKNRDAMFSERYQMLAREIDSGRIQVPADVASMMESAFKETKIEKPYYDEDLGRTIYPKKGIWNPFFKAFFYGYFITNNSVSNMVFSNENQFESSERKSKLNKGYNSSGLRGVIGGAYNLPAKTNVLKVEDIIGNYEAFNTLLGQDSEFVATDGQEVILPIVAQQLSHSLGGQYSMSQYNDVSIKVFHQATDLLEHVADQNKIAQVTLNEDIYENSEFGPKLLKTMLTSGPNSKLETKPNDIDLWEKFQEIRDTEGTFNGEQRKPSYTEAMELLYNFIAEHDVAYPEENIHDNYVGIVSNASGNKTENGSVNPYTIDQIGGKEDLISVQRDNSGLYFQLNLNHEIDTDVARANQLESIVGAFDDIQISQVVDKVNSAFTRKSRKQIIKDIDKAGGIKAFMRQLGISATERMGRANVLGDLFSNNNIDVSLPMLLHTSVQAYISKTNEGVNPRAIGSKMVQMPSYMKMVKVKDGDGNEFYAPKSEASKYDIVDDTPTDLKHYRFVDEDGNDVTESKLRKYPGDYHEDLATVNEAIRKMKTLLSQPLTDSIQKEIDSVSEILSDDGLLGDINRFMQETKKSIHHVTPSQMAMNFPHREKFMIADTESLNDALTVVIGEKSINVRAFVKNKLNPGEYYDRKKRNEILANEFAKLITEEEGFNFKGLKSASDVVNYFSSFLDSLIVYGTRVPTSNFSSAFYAEIEMFTPNSKNVVYIPAEKNLLDGSDFDIDELSIYFKDIITENNVPVVRHIENAGAAEPDYLEEQDNDVLNNTKHDYIVDGFRNPDNIDVVLQPVSVNRLRDLVEDKRKTEAHRFNNDFATAAYNFEASQEGKNMVARFANSIIAYTRLARIGMLSPKTVPGIFNEDGQVRSKFDNKAYVESRVDMVLDTLASVLQASVDNPKEFLLGYMNVNRASGNIVSALVMSGYSDEQLYKFLNKPVVSRTIQSAFDSMSVGNTDVDIIDLIDAKLRTLNEKYINAEASINIDERKRRWKYALTQLVNARATDIEVGIPNPELKADEIAIDVDNIAETVLYDMTNEAVQKATAKANEERATYLTKRINEMTELVVAKAEYAEALEQANRQDAEQKIEDLIEMRQMHFKGEFIWRLTRGFSLYTGIPTKDVARMHLIEDLEFNMGMSLASYVGESKGGNNWMRFAENLTGIANENMVFQDNTDIRDYAEQLITAIQNDSEISPDKVKFITGSSKGFDQEFKRLLSDAGFEIEVYAPKDRRVLLENGRSTYLEESDDITVDNEALSEFQLQRNNAERAGYTININATATEGGGLKSSAKINNVTAEKGSDAQIDEILTSLREQIRKNSDEDGLVVQLTGTSLFRLKTRDKTEYEKFIEREEEVRKIGDVAAVFRQLPNIDEYIKELYRVEKDQQVFFNKAPFIKDMLSEYKNTMRINRLSTNKYMAFNDAVQEFILDMYFNRTDVEFDLNRYGVKSKIYNKAGNFNNEYDREYFSLDFPVMVSQLQDEIRKDPKHPLYKNAFIEALSFTANSIYFDSTFFDDTQYYKAAFNNMANTEGYRELAQMFKYYNLLTHGFKFKNGSYREVIGDEFFEDVSSYVASVNNKLVQNKDNDIKNKFRSHFLGNALLKYEDLTDIHWDRKSDTKWDLMLKNGIAPAVYREKRNNAGAYYQRRAFNGDLESNDPYDDVFVNATDRNKTLPSNRTIESEYEVIRPRDPEVLRRLRSSNKTAEIGFDRKHDYNNGTVIVNGKKARLTVLNKYKIKLTVLDQNPYASEDTNIKERRANERAVQAVVKRIQDAVEYELAENDNQNIFSLHKGETNAILYNPKMINMNRSKIGDLYYLNAALLKNTDPVLFDEITELMNTREDFDGKPALHKVAAALSDEGMFKKKAQVSLVDSGRQSVITRLADLLSNKSGFSDLSETKITFSDSLADLRDSVKSKMTDTLFNTLNVNFQYAQRMDRISNEVAQTLIDRFKSQFGVDAKMVSEDQAREMLDVWKVPNAFFLNGVAYYVENRLRMDTPIHEMLHPFIASIERSNKGLYDSLISEIENSEAGKRILEDVDRLYSARSEHDRKNEALVQGMGEMIAKIMNPRTNKGFIGKLQKLWNSFVSFLRNTFGRNVVPYKLSPDTSMGELANMIAKGNKVLFSNIVSNIPEMQMENGTSRDIVSDLLVPNRLKGKDVADVYQDMENSLITSIYNDLNQMPENKKKYTIYTEKEPITIDLSEMWNKGEATVKAAIRNDILPMMQTNESYKRGQLMGWINNLDDFQSRGSMDEKVLGEFFGYPGTGKRMFSDEVLTEFKSLINYHPRLSIIPYSQLNDYFEGTEFEGIASDQLLDRDPFVVIHREFQSDEETGIMKTISMDISILDVHFGASNLAANPGERLFGNYISDKQHNEFGIHGSANLDEVRKMQMGLMAMRMKKIAGDKVNIRNVGIVNMRKDSFGLRAMDSSRVIPNLAQVKNIPEFVSGLAPEIQELLTDESLHNPLDYTPGYISMLRNFLYEEQTNLREAGFSEDRMPPKLKENIHIIDRYIEGQGSEQELRAMLEYRRQRLEQTQGINTLSAKLKNEEYWLISEILGNMKGFRKASSQSVSTTKDANVWEEFGVGLHDMQNEILHDFYSIMRNQTKFATGEFDVEFRNPFQELIKKVNKIAYQNHPELRGTERVADVGHVRFERMFKKKEITDLDGNQREINTFELYLDRSEPGAENLSNEELELARFIAKQSENYIKDMIRHNAIRSGRFYEYDERKIRILKTERLDEYVASEYNKFWKPGMLPLMHKRGSQYFFDGRFGDAAKRYWNRLSNPVEMFDEVLEMTEKSGNTDSAHSYFWDQYSGDATMGYGSKRRMAMLGLVEGKEGDVYIDGDVGVKANKDLNPNLEDVMDFFVMDAIWKQRMDNEVIPEYHGAMVRLNGMELMTGIAQKANRRHIKTIFDKVVRGKHQLEHESKSWENVAAAMNIAYKLTTFNGVALSIPVAITSAIGNLTELNLHALASSVANPYDTFNWQELTKAKFEMFRNPDLIEKLTHYYQVTEHERFDVLTNPRYKSATNHMWTSRTMHIMNWITDYTVRQLVMVAQMMHDGSYQAHYLDKDGNVKYNAKKDRRFYNPDGSQSKKQKALADWVTRNLVEDPRADQEPDKDPVRGYDVTDQRKFEWISSHFVTGTYNQESTGRYDSFIMLKLAGQFKKYLIDKTELRIGGVSKNYRKKNRKLKAEGGFKHIILDENGNTKEEWVKLETDGIYTSTVKYLVHDVFGSIFKGKELKKMDELEKYNAVRMAGDALMFTAIYFLFTGMTELIPDDERKKARMNVLAMRPMMAIKNGLMTALAVTPGEMLRTLSVPSFEQVKRLWNLVSFNGTSTDLRRSLPGMATTESFQDILDFIGDENE